MSWWDKFDKALMFGWLVSLTIWLVSILVLVPALLVIAHWRYAWCLCGGVEIWYIIGSTVWGFFIGLVVFPKLFRALKQLVCGDSGC